MSNDGRWINLVLLVQQWPRDEREFHLVIAELLLCKSPNQNKNKEYLVSLTELDPNWSEGVCSWVMSSRSWLGVKTRSLEIGEIWSLTWKIKAWQMAITRSLTSDERLKLCGEMSNLDNWRKLEAWQSTKTRSFKSSEKSQHCKRWNVKEIAKEALSGCKYDYPKCKQWLRFKLQPIDSNPHWHHSPTPPGIEM